MEGRKDEDGWRVEKKPEDEVSAAKGEQESLREVEEERFEDCWGREGGEGAGRK